MEIGLKWVFWLSELDLVPHPVIKTCGASSNYIEISSTMHVESEYLLNFAKLHPIPSFVILVLPSDTGTLP